MKKKLTPRTLQNDFFNQVVRILCHTIGFVSKNPAQRANQISKSSSDDPFQAIFHFFIDFSRRKIDHFSRVQPFHRRFAPFSPSSISAPYRKVTILYPSNIESTQLPSKPPFYMAEPHISTFRVFAPYRIVTLLYPSNIGPIAPKFSDRPFSENSSNSIGR